jgi:hypothetical protein
MAYGQWRQSVSQLYPGSDPVPYPPPGRSRDTCVPAPASNAVVRKMTLCLGFEFGDPGLYLVVGHVYSAMPSGMVFQTPSWPGLTDTAVWWVWVRPFRS